MSPELATLDELLCEDLPLAVVRGLFDDGDRFVRAVSAMLETGEVCLYVDDDEVPRWERREALAAARDGKETAGARLAIAEAGVRRIG